MMALPMIHFTPPLIMGASRGLDKGFTSSRGFAQHCGKEATNTNTLLSHAYGRAVGGAAADAAPPISCSSSEIRGKALWWSNCNYLLVVCSRSPNRSQAPFPFPQQHTPLAIEQGGFWATDRKLALSAPDPKCGPKNYRLSSTPQRTGSA